MILHNFDPVEQIEQRTMFLEWTCRKPEDGWVIGNETDWEKYDREYKRISDEVWVEYKELMERCSKSEQEDIEAETEAMMMRLQLDVDLAAIDRRYNNYKYMTYAGLFVIWVVAMSVIL